MEQQSPIESGVVVRVISAFRSSFACAQALSDVGQWGAKSTVTEWLPWDGVIGFGAAGVVLDDGPADRVTNLGLGSVVFTSCFHLRRRQNLHRRKSLDPRLRRRCGGFYRYGFYR